MCSVFFWQRESLTWWQLSYLSDFAAELFSRSKWYPFYSLQQTWHKIQSENLHSHSARFSRLYWIITQCRYGQSNSFIQNCIRNWNTEMEVVSGYMREGEMMKSFSLQMKLFYIIVTLTFSGNEIISDIHIDTNCRDDYIIINF